jgi:hypothetical protein
VQGGHCGFFALGTEFLGVLAGFKPVGQDTSSFFISAFTERFFSICNVCLDFIVRATNGDDVQKTQWFQSLGLVSSP